MARERPPSYQFYPRDFAATMHQLGASDAAELAYRRALDASWDEGWYGVGTLPQWLAWGRATEAPLRDEFVALLGHVSQAQADGSLAQLRMVTERMEQELRHRSASERGRMGGLKSRRRSKKQARKPSPSRNKHSQPHSSASVPIESTSTPSLLPVSPTLEAARAAQLAAFERYRREHPELEPGDPPPTATRSKP